MTYIWSDTMYRILKTTKWHLVITIVNGIELLDVMKLTAASYIPGHISNQ